MPNQMLGHLTMTLPLIFATLRTEVTPPAAPVVERPAHISFLSVPDGATVRLNGRQLEGTTPIEFQEVQPGISIVEFEKEGYEPLRLQQFWGSGAAARLDVKLIPLPTPTSLPTATMSPTRVTVQSSKPAPAMPPAVRVIEPSPPKRPKATAGAARAAAPTAVAPTTTTVSLISHPPGAKVLFNGKPLEGVTPLEKLALPAGKATMEFQLENHQPLIQKRSWKAGTEDIVAVELKPLPARLSVISTPSGASVKLNGVILEGQTPIEGALVPAGHTQVLVELENHLPALERRDLPANGEMRIEVQLKALDTVVRFESDPPGATIILNGEVLPTKSPAGPMPLPPQHARVEFQLEGHAPKVVERDWLPNGIDAIMVKLTPNPGRVRFESPSSWDAMAVDGGSVALTTDSWLPLPAGPHRVLAQQGENAAETEFVVPPGGDVVVTLNWANKRPAPTTFVELPALRATLGDKRFEDSNPVHEVDVPAFWMARREATVDEYRQCVDAGRCETPGSEASCNWSAPDRGKHPINCVNVKDAEAYAAWLSEREGIPYRLPTVDEWERAARGNGSRSLPWGDEPAAGRCNTCDRSCAIERFRDEAFNDSWPETAPVGVLAYCLSNDGVGDLIGNIAEWTRVGATGDNFQVRGGSWAQTGIFLDPALGVAQAPTARDPSIGFRLVVSAEGLPSSPPVIAPPPTATAADTPTVPATPTAADIATPLPEDTPTPRLRLN